MLFDARERGDIAEIARHLHPDVVVTTIADGRTYRGIDEALGYFASLQKGPDRVEVSARRLVPEGDVVRVHGRIRTITRGRLVDSPAAWTFVIREGLVTRITPAPSG